MSTEIRLCLPLLLFCCAAKADFVPCLFILNGSEVSGTCQNVDFVVDVILGKVQVFAPDNTPLSTTKIVTTDFPLWPDLESQAVNDPLPWTDGVPTDIRDQLPNLIGNTDLGIFVSPQGQVTFDQADQALVSHLESLGQPFNVIGDNIFNVGDVLGYGYYTIVPLGSDQFDIGFPTIDYYEHDLQLQLTAVPEPDSWMWLAGGLLVAAAEKRKLVARSNSR